MEFEDLLLDDVSTTESLPPPTSSIKGSLDYIDSLPSSSPFSVSSGLVDDGRNTAVISNAISNDDSYFTALPRRTQLLTDNRRWNPTTDFDPGSLNKGAAEMIAPKKNFDDINDKKYRKAWERLNPSPLPKPKIKANQIAFDNPLRVSICIKRKIRREVMHALGLSGFFRKPRHFNPYSRVRC